MYVHTCDVIVVSYPLLPHSVRSISGRIAMSASTGHSLGGSLASLAAFDIARGLQPGRLQTYTFGAPRVGCWPEALFTCPWNPDTTGHGQVG